MKSTVSKVLEAIEIIISSIRKSISKADTILEDTSIYDTLSFKIQQKIMDNILITYVMVDEHETVIRIKF